MGVTIVSLALGFFDETFFIMLGRVSPSMHFMFWPRRSYAKQTHRHAKKLFFILEPSKLYANLKKLRSVAKWKGSPAHFAISCRLCKHAAVFGVSRSAFGAFRLPPFSILH